MRVSDVQKLGLRKRTLDELEVNIGDVITNDEFNKPSSQRFGMGPEPTTYDKRAIERLVELKLPFSSNCNIIVEMYKRYVSVVCPHCGGKMVSSGGGGNSEVQHIDYRCEKKECGTKVAFSMSHDGFSIMPCEDR